MSASSPLRPPLQSALDKTAGTQDLLVSDARDGGQPPEYRRMPSASLSGGGVGCRDRCTIRSGGRDCHAIRGGLPRDHDRSSLGSGFRPASPSAPCPVSPKRPLRRRASPWSILPSSIRASSPKILPRGIAPGIKWTVTGFVPSPWWPPKADRRRQQSVLLCFGTTGLAGIRNLCARHAECVI